MVDQTIINWLFVGFGAALGWVMKVVWDSITELKADVKQIERDLPEIYVRKDDFRETIAGLRDDIREVKTDMKEGFRSVSDTLTTMSKKLDRKEDRL